MINDSKIVLSIVIVTWNSKQMTLDCLKSIYAISDFRGDLSLQVELNGSRRCDEAFNLLIEVILIDNNSNDNTLQEIKNIFPEVILISNEENIGYAAACNRGMKIAKGKYVLLLGNDTILKDYSLKNCIEFLEKNENCGAVGCKLIYPDGRLQGNCKKFPTLKNAFFTYSSLDKLNYDYDMQWFKYNETIEVDQIATTFLMIRNDVLKIINYFDEQYKILYNDVDLCKKIWNSGYKIFFLNTSEIVHYGSHSTTKANHKIRKIMYEDILKYYKNNFGFKAKSLLPVLKTRFIFVSLFKK